MVVHILTLVYDVLLSTVPCFYDTQEQKKNELVSWQWERGQLPIPSRFTRVLKDNKKTHTQTNFGLKSFIAQNISIHCV